MPANGRGTHDDDPHSRPDHRRSRLHRLPPGLRFFNVCGPRQALSNPYTGVLAIFAARYLAGEPPLVFEDGRQRRDFVAVRDVARACRLALGSAGASGRALNACSGSHRSVIEVAEFLGETLGLREPRPEITNTQREGDVRHCFGDAAEAERVLGWRAERSLAGGLAELVRWLSDAARRDGAPAAGGDGRIARPVTEVPAGGGRGW